MKPDDSLLTIVIPAYNEAESLSSFINELIDYCGERNWKILIVNDGSKDAGRRVTSRPYPTLSVPL